MERALVRNLSDHLGNNLVHVVARVGHVSLLPWLAARLGPELESALSDENKQGLTPISLAIKVNIFSIFLKYFQTNTNRVFIQSLSNCWNVKLE